MASRMKRMFHRKKDDEEAFDQREPHPSGSEPALRTSRYDTTVAGGLPQTGDYPIKGNDSSVALTQQGRKSSVRSRRSSGSQNRLSRRSVTPDHYSGQRNFGANPRPPSDIVNPDLQASNYQRGPASSSGHETNQKRSHTQLPQEFSNLSLGNTGPTTVTQTVTTTHFTPNSQRSRGDPPQGAANAPTTNPTIRPVRESIPQKAYKTPIIQQRSRNRTAPQSYHPSDASHFNDGTSQHQPPIPRKQVGATSSEQPYSPANRELSLPTNLEVSPYQRTANAQLHSDTAVTSPPNPAGSGGIQPTPNVSPQHMMKPIRPRGNSRGIPSALPATNAQEIANRAKTNTVETHVTESVAPAITQEVVHSNIHHIREELITREIHEHDVYHRVLPVIDVEVLPPRHFLPVEGGGLVEIGAKEVPGRGNHWVIAETASKIPSDQVAPAGRRPFSARQFPGREGDTKRYTAAEGHEKTEETWVHPPELETGARDAGQTWPMYFGEGTGDKNSREHVSPKSAKKRNSRKSFGSHPNPGERGSSLGNSG